jgi:hypothetical protein
MDPKHHRQSRAGMEGEVMRYSRRVVEECELLSAAASDFPTPVVFAARALGVPEDSPSVRLACEAWCHAHRVNPEWHRGDDGGQTDAEAEALLRCGWLPVGAVSMTEGM